ncbi:MAG TPA: Tic20 family protein [Coleofasciculaceae cyanobacterium]
MAWRGTTSPLDRTFACLPYLLPLLDGLIFAVPILNQFPVIRPIFAPLLVLYQIYQGVPFLGLIIFFALFLLVVRNENVSHFIRFNTMQAILLDIVLILCSIISQYVLQPALGGGLLLETLYNVVFLGTVAAIVYSVAQSVLGRYAEIPTISDAVYMQVR